MKTKNAILPLAVLLPLFAVLTPRGVDAPLLRDAPNAGKSIYGQDNRIDYYNASAETMATARSVVSLWEAPQVVDQGSSYRLMSFTLRDSYNLCPGQRFAEQYAGAFCSGSLVGEDLVMTAGHCIKDEAACANTKFVFGYRVDRAGSPGAANVAKDQVYGCSSIVTRKLEENVLGSDYALIKLDRKVTGHKPLPINRSGTIANGTRLMVIGHPSGLPVKISANSKVRDASNASYFVADLDTFGGNSGSPVFNTATKKIEGILVRGDEDYHETPAGCTVVTVYAQNAGRGEDVTKVSQLSSFIPMLKSEKSSSEYQDVDPASMPAQPSASKAAAPAIADPFR